MSIGSEVVGRVQKSPLLRDLAVSAAFGVVGIVFLTMDNALISHLSGAAIGFGFGYAIHSVIAKRD